MSFKEHCKSIGVQLLREDLTYIKKCLLPYSKSFYKPILETYIDVWLDGMASCPIEHKKQNVGRVSANSWLREYIDER